MVASVNNIFENTAASEESIKQTIDDAISKSTGLLQNATFKSKKWLSRIQISVKTHKTLYDFTYIFFALVFFQAHRCVSRSQYPVTLLPPCVQTKTVRLLAPVLRATSPLCSQTSAAKVHLLSWMKTNLWFGLYFLKVSVQTYTELFQNTFEDQMVYRVLEFVQMKLSDPIYNKESCNNIFYPHWSSFVGG